VLDPNSALGKNYDSNTLQTIFSSTKSLTAIAIGCAVERGLLNYNEKVKITV